MSINTGRVALAVKAYRLGDQQQASIMLIEALGEDPSCLNLLMPTQVDNLITVAAKSAPSALVMLRKMVGRPESNAAGGSPITKDNLYHEVQREVAAQIKEPITDACNVVQRALDANYTAREEKLAALLPGMIAKGIKELVPNTMHISVGSAPPVVLDDTPHKTFNELMQWLALRNHVYLVGPAGSGKTTGAAQAAKALSVAFYFSGAVKSETDLTGFVSPITGTYHRTPFREAFEHGGLFLLDEMDGGEADALICFNQALANGECAFPDGIVHAHSDFYAIGAANTYGRGADRQYVGRNQLDAATLDRFVTLVWDYDEELERRMSGHDDWVTFVQDVRAAIAKARVRHVMSPRTSQRGAKALHSGMSRYQVEETLIWGPMDSAARDQVKSIVKDIAESRAQYTGPSPDEMTAGAATVLNENYDQYQKFLKSLPHYYSSKYLKNLTERVMKQEVLKKGYSGR